MYLQNDITSPFGLHNNFISIILKNILKSSLEFKCIKNLVRGLRNPMLHLELIIIWDSTTVEQFIPYETEKYLGDTGNNTLLC